MEGEKIAEIIKQVLNNPQIANPPISYKITDVSSKINYSSEYIDIADFKKFLNRLEKQLIVRLTK